MAHSVNLKKRRFLESYYSESDPKKIKLDGSRTDFDEKNKENVPPTTDPIVNLNQKINGIYEWNISNINMIAQLDREMAELQLLYEIYENQNSSAPETISSQMPKNLPTNIESVSTKTENPHEDENQTKPLFEMNKTTKLIDGSDRMISIGLNGSMVSEKLLQEINWKQSTTATRKLLMALFDRETLASHTLTGKPSPAFMGCNRPLKNRLDTGKVADIIEIVTKYSNVKERDVRSAITTKCADENKMLRQRQQKKRKSLN